MKFFAIGDTHLSGNPPQKPMDIFGPQWVGHWDKIKQSWQNLVSNEDIVFIVGDISWALRLTTAQEDLDEIRKLPGKKYMIRGNHDYWWASAKKLAAATNNEITFLQGHAAIEGNVVFGGSRGYLCPGDKAFKKATDRSIYERELMRTEAALKEMELALTQTGLDGSSPEKQGTRILLLHYPPFNDKNEPSGFTDLMEKYKIDICIFGHLHDTESHNRIPPIFENTRLELVSADFLKFTLKEIL